MNMPRNKWNLGQSTSISTGILNRDSKMFEMCKGWISFINSSLHVLTYFKNCKTDFDKHCVYKLSNTKTFVSLYNYKFLIFGEGLHRLCLLLNPFDYSKKYMFELFLIIEWRSMMVFKGLLLIDIIFSE